MIQLIICILGSITNDKIILIVLELHYLHYVLNMKLRIGPGN
jgi:hypothetical protein